MFGWQYISPQSLTLQFFFNIGTSNTIGLEPGLGAPHCFFSFANTDTILAMEIGTRTFAMV